jgi:hypothetical protein
MIAARHGPGEETRAMPRHRVPAFAATTGACLEALPFKGRVWVGMVLLRNHPWQKALGPGVRRDDQGGGPVAPIDQ